MIVPVLFHFYLQEIVFDHREHSFWSQPTSGECRHSCDRFVALKTFLYSTGQAGTPCPQAYGK